MGLRIVHRLSNLARYSATQMTAEQAFHGLRVAKSGDGGPPPPLPRSRHAHHHRRFRPRDRSRPHRRGHAYSPDGDPLAYVEIAKGEAVKLIGMPASMGHVFPAERVTVGGRVFVVAVIRHWHHREGAGHRRAPISPHHQTLRPDKRRAGDRRDGNI